MAFKWTFKETQGKMIVFKLFMRIKNDENKIIDFGNIIYANLIFQGKSLELYYLILKK